MATPKPMAKKVVPRNMESTKVVEEKPKTKTYRPKDFHCMFCDKNYVKESFYNSNSIIAKVGNKGKLWVCKDCVVKIYEAYLAEYEDLVYSVFRTCRLLDMYYDEGLVKGLIPSAEMNNTHIMKLYIMKINSLPQYNSKTFGNSAIQQIKFRGDDVNEVDSNLTERDRDNRKEMIGLIGYDPFEDSNTEEKPFLYNTVLSYLDEGTLNDSFKLSAVIEITKMFSQLDIINKLISNITKDMAILDSEGSKLKQYISIKRDLTSQIMSFAKENKITATKQDSNSKGADTFSGKLKELREKKIRPSDANLFNIKTSEAFINIAKISNESITKQLMWD